MAWSFSASMRYRTIPYEEGTERLIVVRICLGGYYDTEPFPMKRELKGIRHALRSGRAGRYRTIPYEEGTESGDLRPGILPGPVIQNHSL